MYKTDKAKGHTIYFGDVITTGAVITVIWPIGHGTLRGSHMFCFCIFFNDFSQPNYHNVHWTDFHAVSAFGSAMAVDELSEP